MSLQWLPPELIDIILEYSCSSCHDLFILSQVCSCLRHQCHQSALWHTLEDAIVPPLRYFHCLHPTGSLISYEQFKSIIFSQYHIETCPVTAIKQYLSLNHFVHPYQLRDELLQAPDCPSFTIDVADHTTSESSRVSPSNIVTHTYLPVKYIAIEYSKRYCQVRQQFDWYVKWIGYIRRLNHFLHRYFDRLVAVVISLSMIGFIVMTILLALPHPGTVTYHAAFVVMEISLLGCLSILLTIALHDITTDICIYRTYQYQSVTAMTGIMALLASLLLFIIELHCSLTGSGFSYVSWVPISLILPPWLLLGMGFLLIFFTPPNLQYVTFLNSFELPVFTKWYFPTWRHALQAIGYLIVCSTIYIAASLVLFHLHDSGGFNWETVALPLYPLVCGLLLVGLLRVGATLETFFELFTEDDRMDNYLEGVYSAIGGFTALLQIVSIAYGIYIVNGSKDYHLLPSIAVAIVGSTQLVIVSFPIEKAFN